MTSGMTGKRTPDQELADELALCYADPLRFVHLAYPWGKPGPLLHATGPDKWQTEVLNEIGAEVRKRKFDGFNAVAAIREAIASGHGIGKSTAVAWIVDWIMSTRPFARGTVTANTFSQLETKTWAAIRFWTSLCITSHWFEVTGDAMYHKQHPSSWRCDAQTCKEENSEAFAGQHAANSTSFYIFDEASAVPDRIFEVAEGGLTDGEPMIFLFGNPTRSTGKFHRVAFGGERNRWNSRSIDSREAALTNKAQIQEWIDDFGEDSDFVRVRVRGLPPRASDLQYIGADLVFDAQKREPLAEADDPLIVGVDIARGGMDNSVIRFRRGYDARTVPAIRIPGEETRDSTRLVLKIAEILATDFDGQKPQMCFLDGTGIGGPIYDRLKSLGYDNVVEINFAWKAPDPKFANMRAYMWGKLKDWLRHGAIDGDPVLETDLTAPGYTHDKQERLLLEAKDAMKKRGLSSPDDGDALALTFAQPVGPAVIERSRYSASSRRLYDPSGAPGAWMV